MVLTVLTVPDAVVRAQGPSATGAIDPRIHVRRHGWLAASAVKPASA